MKNVTVTKNGKTRTFYYLTSKKEKEKFKHLKKILEEYYFSIYIDSAYENNHGFLVGRSSVTNARAHIGYKYTLSFDIENFFDSISSTVFSQITRFHRAKKYYPILKNCFINGKLPQGLPTSPIISNIVGRNLLTNNINQLLGRDLPVKAVFTRYVDDLTFSFDDISHKKRIEDIVRTAIKAGPFKINERKTKFQSSEWRVVTGVSVGKYGIKPTRETLKKLRAAEHQKNEKSANGLREWCKLKLPAWYKE